MQTNPNTLQVAATNIAATAVPQHSVRFVAPPPFPTEFWQLPNEQRGRALWAWWVMYRLQAARLWDEGIPIFALPAALLNIVMPWAEEHIRTKTLQASTRNEGMLGVERAFHLCAAGDYAGGGRMIGQWRARRITFTEMHTELATGRSRQRARGRKPRLRDHLQYRLVKMVEVNFYITPSQAEEEIERLIALPDDDPKERKPRIERIIDGRVEWREPKNRCASAPLSGLKDRLQTARTFVKKNRASL
jgi:hypothetical protein